MRDVYMEDEDYFRLIDWLLGSPLGTILGDAARDLLMMRLGLDAGIWPESSRTD